MEETTKKLWSRENVCGRDQLYDLNVPGKSRTLFLRLNFPNSVPSFYSEVVSLLRVSKTIPPFILIR